MTINFDKEELIFCFGCPLTPAASCQVVNNQFNCRLISGECPRNDERKDLVRAKHGKNYDFGEVLHYDKI